MCCLYLSPAFVSFRPPSFSSKTLLSLFFPQKRNTKDCMSKRGRPKHLNTKRHSQTKTRATQNKEIRMKNKPYDHKLDWDEMKAASFLLISFSHSSHQATCTSQRSQQGKNEWHANVSWHVKLWLDQITKCSTINGWAEQLSFYTEEQTRFSYQQASVTLPVSIMKWNTDRIMARSTSTDNILMTQSYTSYAVFQSFPPKTEHTDIL